MSKIRVFEQKDADRKHLNGKRVAVIGYGSQGHAHALNLNDSGVDVVVGLPKQSKSVQRASDAGLTATSVPEAVGSADIVSVLIPDLAQRAAFCEQILPNLKADATLLFAHGFNISYGAVEPPSTADVIMVAPKAPGAMVRREFVAGVGVPALVAVHQDASGNALDVALAYADAIGCMRAGVLETSFQAETETDLFGEQAVLCGGVSSLIKAGFETLVDAGYAPELAYFECLHEMKMIVDLIQSDGLAGMRAEVSDTAEYGDYVSGPRVIGDASRQAMRDVLGEIQSGAFARRVFGDGDSGNKELEQLRGAETTHPLEEVGKNLRARMAWL